ncbi:MAG: membrane protein insertion efficiency factor YidD [Spirochaetales bacterium]
MQCSRILRRAATIPVRAYQLIVSPWLPQSCIYAPTCSHYTREAIMRHGVLKGWILGLARIFRCIGGLFEGGADPVPDRPSLSVIGGEYRKRFRFRRANRVNANESPKKREGK